MALLKIPIESTPESYQFKTTVGETVYQVKIQWNTRDERWFIYFYTDTGAHLCSSPLVVNHPLTKRFHIVELNTSFALINLRSKEEVNKEELGSSCILLVDSEAVL